MAKKFENKKLNKDDHAKVDKEADAVRGVVKGVTFLTAVGVAAKMVPWKKIANAAGNVIFRA